MISHFQTSNFKVAYSAEVASATKAGQTSNKLQISKFKIWCLVFGSYLMFVVWSLNFSSEGASDA